MNLPVRTQRLDAAGVSHVTGFDAVHAEPGVEVEGIAQLRLIVGNVGRGLMVADQVHALRARVVGDRLEIEVGVGFCETEALAIREPVTVPTLVPALDEHAAETVLRGKVDVVFGVRGGRPMLRARSPAGCPQVHLPPDADVLIGLEPGNVAELVGLIEIEDQVGHVQAARVVGDLQCAPGRGERRRALHPRSL